MRTRRVAYAVVLTALAVILSPLFIPIGPAKVFPAQHMINLIAAVLLGPWYAVAVAFAASVIRNAAGTGTLFAFPGSTIGAFLAGYIFQGTRNVYLSALGEIIGTGILGALISTLIVAPVLMGRVMEATALIVPFLTSSLAGSIIGLIALTFLQRASIIKQMPLE